MNNFLFISYNVISCYLWGVPLKELKNCRKVNNENARTPNPNREIHDIRIEAMR